MSNVFYTGGLRPTLGKSVDHGGPTYPLCEIDHINHIDQLGSSVEGRPTYPIPPPPSVRGEPQNGPFWGFWGLLGDPSGAFRAQMRRQVHATVCILSFWWLINH